MALALHADERAFIYTWFANLLGCELSEAQWQALQNGSFAPFFELATELGFGAQVTQFQHAVAAAAQQPHSRLELAADYAQLFLLDGQNSALPYASAYLSGEPLAALLNATDHHLAQLGLALNRAQNEPSDHLCIFLEILPRLFLHNPPAAQHFITQHLLNWLPQLIEKAHQIPLKSAFYPQLLIWLAAFLQQEVQ